jgi:hypothetical protein
MAKRQGAAYCCSLPLPDSIFICQQHGALASVINTINFQIKGTAGWKEHFVTKRRTLLLMDDLLKRHSIQIDI